MNYLTTFLQNFNLLETHHIRQLQWPIILIGGFSGFFGSMLDSFLGGSLQYSGKY